MGVVSYETKYCMEIWLGKMYLSYHCIVSNGYFTGKTERGKKVWTERKERRT